MKIKVLVVDDNEVSVSLVKKYFNGSNDVEICDSALNGVEAIELINSKKYDVILLDLIMPLKDGFGVLEYLKDNNIKVPVIVTTSYSEDETIRRVSEYGVKYYALKPFDMNNLKNKIIEIANSYKNREELVELSDKGLQIEVTNILHSLGIPSHIKG